MSERDKALEASMERSSLLLKALQGGDRKTWKQLATDMEFGDVFRGMQSGNPQSFIMAAEMYMQGMGLPQNPKMALKLLTGVLDSSPPSVHPRIQDEIAQAKRILGQLEEAHVPVEDVSDAIVVRLKDTHLDIQHRVHPIRITSQE